ncbi:MAG: hypothetical protein U0694_20750 [Anaerolineae bacterium]
MPRRQGFKPGMLGRRMWSFARARIQRYAADFPLDVEDSSLPLAENVSWEEPREEAPAPNEPPVVTARPARSTQEFPSTPRPAAPASSTPPPLARNVPPPAPPAPPTPAPPRTTPRAAAPSATPPPVQRAPAAPPPQRPAASAPPVSAPRPAAPSLRPAAPTPQTAEVRRQPAQSRPSNQPQEYKTSRTCCAFWKRTNRKPTTMRHRPPPRRPRLPPAKRRVLCSVQRCRAKA